MALQLDFSIEGTERVSRVLDITVDGVKDFKKPFTDVGRSMLKTFDMNFDARGGLYGGWAPRKPQFRGGTRIDTWPLLEKSGAMRKGFKSTVKKDSVELTNSRSYFVYHQSNTARTRLPRRVMMKLRQQDAQMVVKTFQAYLIELARKAGTR